MQRCEFAGKRFHVEFAGSLHQAERWHKSHEADSRCTHSWWQGSARIEDLTTRQVFLFNFATAGLCGRLESRGKPFLSQLERALLIAEDHEVWWWEDDPYLDISVLPRPEDAIDFLAEHIIQILNANKSGLPIPTIYIPEFDIKDLRKRGLIPEKTGQLAMIIA